MIFPHFSSMKIRVNSRIMFNGARRNIIKEVLKFNLGFEYKRSLLYYFNVYHVENTMMYRERGANS